MKKSVMAKIIAALLAVCFAAAVFAGCGKDTRTVMSLTKNGKTYTITADEFSLLMMINKLDFCCSSLITRSTDTLTYWAKTTEDGETYEDYYKNAVMERTKAILVEKYLTDTLGLKISADKLAEYKEGIKTANASYGGKGAYKQYFGYTASEYYNVYMNMVSRSELVLEHLYGENGEYKVTAEDLETYFQENYVGYIFIVLDMKNRVVRDEDGNRIIKMKENKDGESEPSDTYETEALTDEEKEEKQTLAKTILTELENGADFADLVQKYSDEYYSVEFPDGMFVLKEGKFINATVTDKIKDLEIGEYTTEEITSGDYQYIIKRVDLVEGVYDRDEYLELFEGYDDTVKYDKYETYVESFFEEINVDEAVCGEFTMADTYLSKYADYYYQLVYNSYFSSLY